MINTLPSGQLFLYTKDKKNKTKTKLKTVRDNIASTVDVSTGKKCTGKYGPEKL